MFLVTALAAAAASSPAPASTVEAPAPAPIVLPAPLEDEVKDGVWVGSVNLGGVFTSGNTETTGLAVSANAHMKDGPNRYIGRIFYNYTRDRGADFDNNGNPVDGRTIQDNRGLEVEYNRFLNERLYGLAQGSLFTDEQEDIRLDLRTTLGVGVGYQILTEEEMAWDAELGISAVDEDFAVDANDNDFTAARVSSSFDWQANEQVHYTQTLTALQSLDESDDYLLTNDSKVGVKMTESMVAAFQYVFALDNTPPAGAEEEDHSLILSLGWTF